MENKVTVIMCGYELQWRSMKQNTEQKYSNKTYKTQIVAKTNSAFQ